MVADAHVALETLWKYRKHRTPLTPDQLTHLCRCDDCLALFGACRLSNAMEEVKKLLEGKPRTGTTN